MGRYWTIYAVNIKTETSPKRPWNQSKPHHVQEVLNSTSPHWQHSISPSLPLSQKPSSRRIMSQINPLNILIAPLCEHNRSHIRLCKFLSLYAYFDKSRPVIWLTWNKFWRDGFRVWTLVGTRIFTPFQTGSGAHPTSCTIGNGSFPEVQRLELSVHHSPHVAPKLKK